MWTQSQQNAKLRMLLLASDTGKTCLHFSPHREDTALFESQKIRYWFALRAVALRRESSSTDTALRRGMSGCGKGIEARSCNFAVKSAAGYIESFASEGKHSNGLKTKTKGENGQIVVSTLRSGHGTCDCVWKVIKPRRLSRFRANTVSVLANPSLNRTLCGGPRLAFISFSAKHGPPQSAG